MRNPFRLLVSFLSIAVPGLTAVAQTNRGGINVATNSRTNSFNGVALWYQRNPVTSARPWRSGAGPRPPNNLRYNQFSGSVGGPIWLPKKIFGPVAYDGRNRSFFSFAYEPRYCQDFVTQATILPTAAERAGDFSNQVRTSSGWVPASVAAKFNFFVEQVNNLDPQKRLLRAFARGFSVQTPEKRSNWIVRKAEWITNK